MDGTSTLLNNVFLAASNLSLHSQNAQSELIEKLQMARTFASVPTQRDPTSSHLANSIDRLTVLQGAIDTLVHAEDTASSMLRNLENIIHLIRSRPSSSKDALILLRQILSEAVAQKQTSPSTASSPEARVPFRVVSRPDFIGQYQGHTTERTRQLLHSSRGSVLFIDEVHNLCNDPKDSFGLEAVSEITRFMTEEPNSIIFILAGYESMLTGLHTGEGVSLFTADPGMRRRVTWTFRIHSYTSQQLADVMMSQAERHSWSFEDDVFERLPQYLEKHKSVFTRFGGDTEMWLLYAKLAQARIYMTQCLEAMTTSGAERGSDANGANACDASLQTDDTKNVRVGNMPRLISWQAIVDALEAFKRNRIPDANTTGFPPMSDDVKSWYS